MQEKAIKSERERESYILWFDPYQGRNAMIDATFDWILEFQFNPWLLNFLVQSDWLGRGHFYLLRKPHLESNNEIPDHLWAEEENYCRVTLLTRRREFKWAKTAAGKFN